MDNANDSQPVGDGQDSEVQPQEQGEETPQPTYVTQEELERREAELIRRIKQSDRDRARHIDQELESLKGLLAKPGIELSPEQAQALRNEIADRLDGEPYPEEDAAQQQSPSADPVASFVSDIFAEVGATVTQTDPEWKSLQDVITATWNDPRGAVKVAAAAMKAAEAKKARLENNTTQAVARVGVGTRSGGAASTLDPNAPAGDYWREAYKK